MDRQESILAEQAKMEAKREPVEVVAEVPAPEPEAIYEESKAPEPAAVVSDDHEEDTDESATSDGDDPAAPKRQNKGVGKRINELTREKHEERRARETAEAEAAYWRQQVQQPNPRQPEPTQTANGRPTLEQYGYDQNAYEDARDAWVIGQAKQSWQAEQAQAYQAQKQQEKTSTFQSRLAAFEKESPGAWNEAVAAPLPTTPIMLEAIQESEVGPKLGVYLANHLDEALAISRMAPLNQAIAMGRIEAKLSTPTPSAPPRPTVTRAPAPPPVLQSGAPAGISPSRMGIEDHIAAVIAQKKARYG